MTKEYDIVILGGGTGGYVAAIRASQLGLNVAIVEKEELGGTCLHEGCIPSKTLLKSAEAYRNTRSIEKFGIEVKDITLNFENVQTRKNEVIQHLHRGVKQLLNKAKVDIYYGHGRLLGPSIFSPMSGTISIEYSDGKENTMIVPKHVLIATGSRPASLNEFPINGKNILDSTSALNLTELPSSILIIGGGIIGIEWASMLTDFGVDVTVVEASEHILMNVDDDIRREAERLFKKRGIRFIKNAEIISDSLHTDKDNDITLEVKVDNKRQNLSAEKMIVATGRKANIENIGIENTDIIIENQFIHTNKVYQTKESHIYAIGDCIGGMQLAHVAAKEGMIAVEHIANKNTRPLDKNTVPTCIYSYPEMSKVGLTEREALEQGFEIQVGQFPFQGIGKALVNGETDGFTKIIKDKLTDDILGIHMIGAHVTELISEGNLAKVLDATPWEISHTVHPHPSLSEIFGEVSLAVTREQIHG